MSNIEVKTQAQLDKALKKAKPSDVVVCLGGTWDRPLVVQGSSSVVARDSSRVVARDSSSVVAWDSSSVVARDSSRVVARDSSSVVARGPSRVVARGSSSVVAWDSSSVVARDSSRVVAWDSSRVVARDSSSVMARDSSRVVARDSSSVVAWDSSSVVARDSSRVVARGSSRVVAWDSSSVVAWDSSSVEASPYVAIHKHPGQPTTIKGGVIINVPDLNNATPAEWADYYALPVKRGIVICYKALDDDFSTGYGRENGVSYTPGTKPQAPDWEPAPVCGGGLHVSPAPSFARDYNAEATRYVACPVRLADAVVLGDKIKVPGLAGRTFEVDVHGDRIGAKS